MTKQFKKLTIEMFYDCLISLFLKKYKYGR